MSRFEGKKYQEIADIQSVSVRTIEDRVGEGFESIERSSEWIFNSFTFVYLLISKFSNIDNV